MSEIRSRIIVKRRKLFVDCIEGDKYSPYYYVYTDGEKIYFQGAKINGADVDLEEIGIDTKLDTYEIIENIQVWLNRGQR